MAALAVRLRESDLVVANAAVLACIYFFHRDGVRSLRHLKDRGMAIGTAQPLGMGFVWKNYLEHVAGGGDKLDVNLRGPWLDS